jgi:hypothetical protein
MRLLAALAAMSLSMAACVDAILVDAPGGNGGSGGTGGATTTGGGGVGGGQGGSGGAPCGCDEMDVLLAIDNTTSHLFVNQLVTSFLQLGSNVTDLSSRACSFHFAVVTSTPQLNNPPGCQGLGALSTVDSSGTSCGLSNGKFGTEEDDLLDVIPCLAQTGRQTVLPADERLMDAVFNALTDTTLNGPGGCNEGFFRPNAPLMILIMSDIDDTMSANEPNEWFGQLRALNNGTATGMSAMGLLPPALAPVCNNADGPQLAPRLHAFLAEYDSSKQLSSDLCNVGASDLKDGVAAIADAVCPVL